MTSCLSTFSDLARDLDDRWRRADYHPDAFAPLAAETLADHQLHETISFSDLTESILEGHHDARSVKQHPDSNTITMIDTARFGIVAHLRGNAVVRPHQHGWSGAFQMLDGRALQSRHDFDGAQLLARGLWSGQLRLRGVELVEAGDIVAIAAGPGMIHGLNHIDRPAASVSIRSRRDGETTLDFWAPGIGLEPARAYVEVAGRRNCLDVMYEASEQSYVTGLRRLVCDRDLAVAFMALRHGAVNLDRPEVMRDWIECAAADRRPILLRLYEGAEEAQREQLFVEHRRMIEDPDLRLAMGALFLADEQTSIFETIKRIYPDRSPLEQLSGAIARIVAKASEPALDPSTIELVELIFKALLNGASDDALLEALPNRAKSDEMAEDLLETARAVRISPMFRPLFAARV